ncbi:NHL repeat containing protein (modular protein) [Candidatus Sulfopaludibacter sp. SbA4]|nr:NHL repeat containing protein (modular protein) [Candidatus Sulfopaludibacter sp. SbA4]
MIRKLSLQALAFVGLMCVFTATGKAQTAGPRALIAQSIDENRLVTLAGNTRHEANRENDLGPVADGLHLDMYLQLKRSPEQDRAAEQFVESLTDKNSPNFHKWITAAEYGQRFGAASEDIAAVTRWLGSHGFTVNGVPANNMVIDFSGNAGQVREALHTEIHNLEVAGKRYFANMSDPRIPAALLPAVTGVVSLNNFTPRPMFVPKSEYTVSSGTVPVVPGDLATIYNLNPAFSGGYTGQGQTIVVLEDTDLYNGTGDWDVFRTTFGLDQYPNGSLTQVHPGPGKGGACLAPGINGAEAEAAIDVEWASAAAPNAAIVMASCADTTNFGGFIALQNLLTNGGPLPSVVSISYGESETDSGAAGNSFINTLYQTAAAAGVSVFVASGDEAAAETDHRSEVAIHGVSVSSFASTTYNVAVGGTDFGDTASNATGAFWNSTNGTYYDSAKCYVREMPWNESCASQVLGKYRGFSSSYGAASYCNSTYNRLESVAGSGGPSGCATGVPTITGVVGGTCAGYAKPSWQAIFGNPSDGVRDVPDVALFASAGLWGHYYVFCISDGASCAGAPSTWPGGGGTSFASPIMAGIQALINQALGSANVGNPNPVYYQIGRSEYSAPANRAACGSTTGPASTCSFNDILEGDIEVPCAGSYNCYFGGGGLGVMSTSNTSYAPAYAAASGWDFATGIGSVNASNLLNAFVDSVAPTSAPAAPVLTWPANGATGVSLTPALTWNASTGATSYDVYFGTASTPPLVESTANINYAPGTLSPATTYYWAAGARNSLGATASAAWSFTTSCVSALNPSSATATAAGGTGTIPVTATAGCGWTAVSNAPWITIASGASGSGNGTVGYAVAPDTGAQRAGTIAIAGQTFTVTQGGIYPLISTLAGGAMPATPAPGLSVSIPVSYGVAVDSSGNTYFPSPNLNAVFKADPSGVVTRIAGTGVSGYSGDGGPALGAQLNSPNGVAVDSLGNIYIADTNNWRVRRVDTSGSITTVAGNGGYSYAGDGGPATLAGLRGAYGIAVDAAGSLYIADSGNQVIRKVDTSGTITTVAGNGSYGYSGDGGAATGAKLYYPYGVAVDAAGNLYIADSDNLRVRKVDTSGTITTVAGTGSCCDSGDGGAAASARLGYPYGVAVDAAGNLYIADGSGERVRKVNADGIITTVAGNGVVGFSGDGGAATRAQLRSPQGVAVDGSGNLYIADSGNARIREVNAAGAIATLVGGGVNDGGLGVFGLLNQPSGVVRDNSGNTYIADSNNHRVRKLAASGTIATVAGTGVAGSAGDGRAAASALLNAPQGLALDISGNLYIADSNNHRVRKVDGFGNITTAAGNGGCCTFGGDGGPATDALIGTPYALAVDSSGNLYVSDTSNNVIRMVDTSGTITTVAGIGSSGYAGDGGAATGSKLYGPYGLAVDTAGNLYIADRYNYRVRMVSTTGIITTVAGNGNCCYGGDGGAATKAMLDDPSGVAVDAAGNLYIADTYTDRIRKVTANGTITTVAGGGGYGYSGDGGSATGATFRYPYGISVDAAGNIVVADQNNNAVRLLTPTETQPVLTIQSAHTGAFAPGQTGATYTVKVSNSPGAGATNGAVTVSEILPGGLTLAGMAGPGWTCPAATAATCARSDALSGGSSYPAITVTVNVSATAPGQLTNEASVSGGGANAAGAEDLTVVAAPSAPAASPAAARGR